MKRSDHQTIQQVLDGSISKAGFAAFQERMRTEPEFSKLYGEYALLHHSLCEEYEDQPVPAVTASPDRPGIRTGLTSLAAAAVLAGLAVVAYRANHRPVARPTGVTAGMEFSPDAVWQVEEGAPGNRLSQGSTLHLLQGRARVTPGNGSSAFLDSPARLTFVSPDSLHLAEGRGRFRLDSAAGKLEVTTPSFSAVDLGTEFGVQVFRDKPDELHVLEGEILLRINGRMETDTLKAGQAARIAGPDRLDHFPADAGRFPWQLGDFTTVLGGAFVKSDWRIDFGTPAISPDRIDGGNFAAFSRLAKPEPDADAPVFLATLAVGRPANGEFHTDGWAGLSFFSHGTEAVFFGDSFGPERTWSLDVKQRFPVILPGNPLVGPRSVTLRYDRRSGEVSLHDGAGPLGPPFCSGTLPKDMTFDEIRIGASSNAGLATSGILIRAGGR